jgi:GNAT superfamily N-acetyltransferase
VITVRVARPEEYERVGALTYAAYSAIPVDHLWGGYDTEILDTATRAEHGDILVAVTVRTQRAPRAKPGSDVTVRTQRAPRAKPGSHVTDDDSVVGAVMYVDNPASEWLEWTEPGESQFRLLAVDPTAREHGAGTALVQACIERASTAGHSILIHTTPWMVAAHRIYQHFGFVRRPDRDVPYETWSAGRELELAADWIGTPFLAYTWSARADDASTDSRRPR